MRERWCLANSRRTNVLTSGALQHPFWGGVSSPTPGAVGTALLSIGQKPATRPLAGRIRLRWRRGKASQLTVLQDQRVPDHADFREVPCAAKQCLDRLPLLLGEAERDAILVSAKPVVLPLAFF